MKTLKSYILLCLLAFFYGNIPAAFGQGKELKGKIFAGTTRVGLTYASVNIPGLGISTVSNDDGEFDLKLPGNNTGPQDSIIFSCIGFKSKSIGIPDAFKQPYLIITLMESVIELKEVAVKPLTIKQLLDSISHRNYSAFNSPMKLNGYYREFAFTNGKCNEYSDALFDYYYDNSIKNNAQLKINASRCEKAVKKNNDKQNYEAFINSHAEPDQILSYSMLTELIKHYFPDKQHSDYNYKIEGNNGNNDLLVTIYPKTGTDKVYKLQLLTSDDLVLRWYKLVIPDALLQNAAEKSFLGVHGKTIGLSIETRYGTNNNGIYPQYFKATKEAKISGKLLGTIINQISAIKSEFVITQINTKNVTPIPKNQLYKKGNICDNGVAINIALLKDYNFIPPTKKDSLAISSITKDISSN